MTSHRLHFVLLPLLALVGCDRGEPGSAPEAGGPVEVTVSTAVSGPGVTIHPATVTSTDQVEIRTRSSGTVVRVRADVGSRVGTGDTLVELAAGDVRARIRSAEAELRRATRYHERIRNLERDGAATDQELDDARAALRRAEAGVSEARAQLEYVVLRAPFAGTVTGRMVDPGDLAGPGVPVLTLVRPEALEITADLPAEIGRSTREGDRFLVRQPATGEARGARVVRVSPAADPASRRVRVELRFEEAAEARGAGFVPGAYVRLERETRGESTVWIPADAVMRRGQLTGVYVLEADSLDLRWVRLGLRRGGAVEALAGVEPGDRIVRRPDAGLRDRLPVASARRDTWRPEGGP